MEQSRLDQLNGALNRMWGIHKDYLRRVLIGMTRDVDLAEDLLQETYLCAHKGVSGYRGGDSRAWLAAIARSVFHSHVRQRYVRVEAPLDADTPSTDAPGAGSSAYLTALQLREAIAHLSPTLRTALVMKHFGGFTYQEIAERLGCPAGTARRRVWAAMQKLRSALTPEEETEMKCPEVRRAPLLDFVYGTLPENQAERITAHIEQCAECRAEALEVRRVVESLDTIEGDYKQSRIVDLDETGQPTEYSWSSMVNDFGQIAETTWWTINKDICVDHVTIQGEEVALEILPCGDSQYMYQARLPRPVKPGDPVPTLLVLRPSEAEGRAVKMADDLWRYSFGTTPNSAKEWVFVLAIRIPPNARLVSANPEPTDTKTDGLTTLIWRSLLPKIDPRPDGTWPWQFECVVDYTLDTPAAVSEAPEAPAMQANPSLVWGPPLLFKIHETPMVGSGEQALELFAEAKKLRKPYPHTWIRLGIMLYDGKYYQEALEALRRAARPSWRTLPFHSFVAYTLQGIVLDVLGCRAEAVKAYEKALATGDGYGFQMDQYSLTIDQQWLEERLKTPFVRE